MEKIKVLVVDDSAAVRSILTKMLSYDKQIEVVGTAANPYIARDKILELNPDVITLDINMPKMDGLTFLQKLMVYHPLPVIVISSTTQEGTTNAFKALELGAVEVIAKPDGPYSVGNIQFLLIEKIKGAARASAKKSIHKELLHENAPIHTSFIHSNKKKVIAIGSSTGGTGAIKEILFRLPSNIPGIVIAQHMPAYFTRPFAENLDKHSPLHVKEAQDQDIISEGRVLVAPGGYHTIVKKRMDGTYYVEIKDGPQVNFQKPSCDVLFRSVASCAGGEAIGIILTGMGKDGAAGILEMKKTGAFNIAQDEETSVVFGMPKEAIKNGSIDVVSPVEKIADEVMKQLVHSL